MLLVVDAGNTSVTLGLFRGERLAAQRRVGSHPPGGGRAVSRAVVAFARRASIEAFVYGSVVPGLKPALRSAARSLGLKELEVGPGSARALGLRLAVRSPRQVGADRILNAVAARGLGRLPAVVVDFGTATTFDCLSRRGDYLGGAILPGPRLAAKALSLHTARLPEVPIVRARRVVGKDTVECIQAGLYWGYIGMIEKVLKETLKEMKAPRARVLLTGGLAPLFSKHFKGAKHEPDLTLHGLRLAFERLRTKC